MVGFCDRISAELTDKLAEIEITSLAVGAQVEVRWLPITGLSYAERSDMIEIMLEGIEHVVPHPREVYVQYGPGGLESLGIKVSGSSITSALGRSCCCATH